MKKRKPVKALGTYRDMYVGDKMWFVVDRGRIVLAKVLEVSDETHPVTKTLSVKKSVKKKNK